MRIALSLLAVAALAAPAFAQQIDLPRPSPNAKASQFIGVTEVGVDYSSPGVKNRKIWGGVVPYDKVWRAGANGADQAHLQQGRPHRRQARRRRLVRALRSAVGDEVDLHLESRSQERRRVRLRQGERRLARRRQAAADRDARAAHLHLLELRPTRRAASTSSGRRFARRCRSRCTPTSRWPPASSSSRTAAGGRGPTPRATSWRQKNYDEGMKLVDTSIRIKETWINTFVKAQLLAARGNYKEALPLAQKAKELGDKERELLHEGRGREGAQGLEDEELRTRS